MHCFLSEKNELCTKRIMLDCVVLFGVLVYLDHFLIFKSFMAIWLFCEIAHFANYVDFSSPRFIP